MTMQETMKSQELANLDLTKVAALQQKRTLAFVNHFVITTVQFLNSFMKKCEQKLMNFERKLEKVEAAMVLLETRLSSIPEVNTPQTEDKQEIKPDTTLAKLDETVITANEQKTNKEPEHSRQESASFQNSAIIQNAESQKLHPEYDRFIKMVQVGVPLQAVKLKVTLEGLDPSILEKILAE